MSGRRLVAAGVALVTALALTSACRRDGPPGPRIVILGFDGMDYALTRDLMSAGRMPNFTRIVASGGTFSRLATTVPPQSPVAWSTFMTGLDPGGHGIFDFIHRDPNTMAPYLSTTRSAPAAHTIQVGSWQLPLSAAHVESLRRGTPFWEPLETRGIETTVIRMPADFPPTGTATRELSGMGTPDVLGTYGQFTLLTSAPGEPRKDLGGGVVEHVDASQGVVRAALEGPAQPYRTDGAKMSAGVVAYVDSTRQYVRLVVGDETRLLKVGEWSDWVPVTFDVDPWQTMRAEARFYLRQLDPEFELYVTPVNLDPLAPALPISAPPAYAASLARETGRYYTQGMPEETSALKSGVFSIAEFLRQAADTQAENLRQFRDVLGHFDRGLLFYYFGDVDQVSHMLWRARDPGHPGYEANRDAPFAHAIDDLYVEFDGIVGDTLAALRPGDLLVVMSDHGFAPWDRSFNLNAWLRDQGYARAANASGPSVLGQIDLGVSRAYGLGLNGLYLNLKGREAYGVVDPSQREALLSEITAKLSAIVDPATGRPAIAHVYRREQVFSSGGTEMIAPDLVVGYARGTRVSDESALGELSSAVFSDNTSAWSGDHCMDPDAVPGILLTSRPLRQRADSLQTLAPAILAEVSVPFPGQRVP